MKKKLERTKYKFPIGSEVICKDDGYFDGAVGIVEGYEQPGAAGNFQTSAVFLHLNPFYKDGIKVDFDALIVPATKVELTTPFVFPRGITKDYRGMIYNPYTKRWTWL
jgi:hypothetical protein